MNKLLRALPPIVALVIGVGVFGVLKAKKPEPEKKTVEELGTLVETMTVTRKNTKIVLYAQGTVMPAEQVILQPEVVGRILWRHPNLVPGGIVGAGELLVRLDGSSAQLALRQQEAQVNRAELDLVVEASRKEIAEREWQLLNKSADAKVNPLALRDPQIKTAAVQVEAAKSAREAAKLNVSRTALVAPFNAFVQKSSADRGQLVSTSSQVATLIGIDKFWVQISVPLENVAWMRIPGVNGNEGSLARVTQTIGEQRIERVGKVVRLLGDLDPVGRMARVLVEIEDPFNLRASGDRGLPLLVGAFVDVQIEGGELTDVFELPRTALRDGDHVFVFDKNAHLETRDIAVVWRTPESVLVKKGLDDGDKVITSRLGAAVSGMALRMSGTSQGAKGPSAERK